MRTSTRLLTVPLVVALGLVALSGCTSPTPIPAPQSSEPSTATPEPEVVVPVEISPDLDLASLVPAIDEIDFPSGSAVWSDGARPPRYVDQLYAGAPQRCDRISLLPYWPQVDEQVGRLYREEWEEGTIVTSASVTTFLFAVPATDVLSEYVGLLNSCAGSTTATIVADDANGIYGVTMNNAEGEEVRYAALGRYLIWVRTTAPATADDAAALMREIQRRILTG